MAKSDDITTSYTLQHELATKAARIAQRQAQRSKDLPFTRLAVTDNKATLEALERAKVKEQTAKLRYEAKTVLLDNGDRVDKDVFNALTPEQQQQLKTLGIEGYNKVQIDKTQLAIIAAKEAIQASLAKTVLLDNGERVDKSVYDTLTREQQQQLKTLGIAEFNAKQKIQAQASFIASVIKAQTEAANTVLLNNGERVSINDFNALTPAQQEQLRVMGISAFNAAQQQAQIDFNTNNVRLDTGEYVSRSEFNKLTPAQQQLLMINGIASFNATLPTTTIIEPSNSVKLNTGEYVPKSDWDKLNDSQRAQLNSIGITAFNAAQLSQAQVAPSYSDKIKPYITIGADGKDKIDVIAATQGGISAQDIHELTGVSNDAIYTIISDWQNRVGFLNSLPSSTDGTYNIGEWLKTKANITNNLVDAVTLNASVKQLLDNGFSVDSVSKAMQYVNTIVMQGRALTNLDNYAVRDDSGNITGYNIQSYLWDNKAAPSAALSTLKAAKFTDTDISKAAKANVALAQTPQVNTAIYDSSGAMIMVLPLHAPPMAEFRYQYILNKTGNAEFASGKTTVIAGMPKGWDSGQNYYDSLMREADNLYKNNYGVDAAVGDALKTMPAVFGLSAITQGLQYGWGTVTPFQIGETVFNAALLTAPLWGSQLTKLYNALKYRIPTLEIKNGKIVVSQSALALDKETQALAKQWLELEAKASGIDANFKFVTTQTAGGRTYGYWEARPRYEPIPASASKIVVEAGNLYLRDGKIAVQLIDTATLPTTAKDIEALERYLTSYKTIGGEVSGTSELTSKEIEAIISNARSLGNTTVYDNVVKMSLPEIKAYSQNVLKTIESGVYNISDGTLWTSQGKVVYGYQPTEGIKLGIVDTGGGATPNIVRPINPTETAELARIALKAQINYYKTSYVRPISGTLVELEQRLGRMTPSSVGSSAVLERVAKANLPYILAASNAGMNDMEIANAIANGTLAQSFSVAAPTYQSSVMVASQVSGAVNALADVTQIPQPTQPAPLSVTGVSPTTATTTAPTISGVTQPVSGISVSGKTIEAPTQVEAISVAPTQAELTMPEIAQPTPVGASVKPEVITQPITIDTPQIVTKVAEAKEWQFDDFFETRTAQQIAAAQQAQITTGAITEQARQIVTAPSVQPATQTATATATQITTQPVTEMPVTVNIPTPMPIKPYEETPPEPKKKIKKPDDEDEDDETKKKREQYTGALTWRQGAFYKAWKEPYNENDVATFKNPPPNAVMVDDGTPQETIRLMGKTVPPPERVVNMGVVEFRIVTDKQGNVKIKFAENKEVTESDSWNFSLSPVIGRSRKHKHKSHRPKTSGIISSGRDNLLTGSI